MVDKACVVSCCTLHWVSRIFNIELLVVLSPNKLCDLGPLYLEFWSLGVEVHGWLNCQ